MIFGNFESKVPPQISGFVCAYHPAALSLCPKHAIYAFSFMLYLSCERNENKQKEAWFGPIFFKKKMLLDNIHTNWEKVSFNFAICVVKGSSGSSLSCTWVYFLLDNFNGTDLFFYKKWANAGLFFVYFRPFLITIPIIQIEKSIDGVLGIRTRDGKRR